MRIKTIKSNKINIVELQLILHALQNIAECGSVHVNTKARIVDLIEKIYQDLKGDYESR